MVDMRPTKPQGFGMPDHSISAAICRASFPGYKAGQFLGEVALPLLSCLVALQQDDFGNRFSDWSYYSCSSLFKPLLLLLLLLLLLPANFIASASPVLRLREGLDAEVKGGAGEAGGFSCRI